MRPLGIPTVKDRVVQMAVYLVLMPIFEADFHPHSYGFRPKRRAHQALEAIRKELWNGRVEVAPGPGDRPRRHPAPRAADRRDGP